MLGVARGRPADPERAQRPLGAGVGALPVVHLFPAVPSPLAYFDPDGRARGGRPLCDQSDVLVGSFVAMRDDGIAWLDLADPGAAAAGRGVDRDVGIGIGAVEIADQAIAV